MSTTKVTIEKSIFGTSSEGHPVEKFSLRNVHGMQVDFITYGGIITALQVPDKKGRIENVVLGFDTLKQYLEKNRYFGVIVGRFGNRIAKGKFTLDGKEYTLALNNGENHLHGGIKGFDKVFWKADVEREETDVASVKLTYLSKDMEEGYPGNLATEVTYSLDIDNTFSITYTATTDKATIVNLTQHSFFNLSGDFTKTILDHEVSIHADHFVPVNKGLIPLGKIAEVQGTPFDFRKPKKIGKEIDVAYDQLEIAGGYDHCWALNNQDSGIREAVSAYHEESGRYMEVHTDTPGLQFYTGNFMDGTAPMPGGGFYGRRTGFCVETQYYPDAPNQENFPSVVLRPGEQYASKTAFTFSVK